MNDATATSTANPSTPATDEDGFTWWACSYTADERPYIQLQRPNRANASSTIKNWLKLTDNAVTFVRLERRDVDGNNPTVFASFRRVWKREV